MQIRNLQWLVWENVPGVLYTKDNAFGNFLGKLVGADGALHSPMEQGRWTDAGMASSTEVRVAWRCLNAQYFGLAQRRRRVFLVAGFGEGTDPAQVLFEQKSMSGSFKESAEAKDKTPSISNAHPVSGGSMWVSTSGKTARCLTASATSNDFKTETHIAPAYPHGGIRRLTPEEWERLQGFPDGYTNIPWRHYKTCPDSSRYRATGNSMPVPVMRWIGERINRQAEALRKEKPA